MFKLTGISKSYGGSEVLADVTLCCEPGQAVCVAGANAAGKTTLLNIAAGLLRPDAGTVAQDGGIGYLPQETALLEELSTRDNLALWYAACGKPKSQLFSENSAEHALGLAPFMRKRVSRLSGGIKKRAALACALISDPAYLIMDEPFAALDLPSRGDITALLCTLKRQGRGLLFSSHDPAAIAAIADRMYLLRGGKIAAETVFEGDQSTRLAAAAQQLSRA